MIATRKLFELSRFTLVGWALLWMTGIGCQSTGGQTSSSVIDAPDDGPYIMNDDVQYFPPGPEFRLSRQIEALEAYKLRQQGLDPDVAVPESPAPDPTLAVQ